MTREFVIFVLSVEALMALYTVTWVIRKLREENLTRYLFNTNAPAEPPAQPPAAP